MDTNISSWYKISSTAMLYDPKQAKEKKFLKAQKIEKKIPAKLKTPKAQRIKVVKTGGVSKVNKK